MSFAYWGELLDKLDGVKSCVLMLYVMIYCIELLSPKGLVTFVYRRCFIP